MTILIFAAILIVLIIVHELGHFLVAKRAGIRVDEFGLGYPPKVWGVKRGETEYTLNLLPLGGFVRIFGEDYEDLGGTDSKRHFTSKPRYVQAAVLAAGIAANILFGWLLISLGFMTGLPSSVEGAPAEVANPELLIVNVTDGSPAEKAGLKPGDELVAVRVGNEAAEMTPEGVSTFIRSHQESALEVTYGRGNAENTLSVAPGEGVIAGQKALGISMDVVGTLKLPPHKAFVEGARSTWNMLVAIVVGIGALIAGAFTGSSNLSQVTGPVGIAGMVGDATELGFAYLLTFTAFISLNLAVINLIPFPALDGGRILFVALEAIRRKSFSPVFVRNTNVVGFVLLLGLMAAVTFNDILRLF